MVGIIYKVTCLITNKVYIGQTIRDLCVRQREHFSDAFGCNSKLHFHKALRKYGKDAFKWEMIRYIDLDCDNIEEKLHRLEKYYIKKYNSYECGYNETIGGEPGRPGFRRVIVYNIDGEKLLTCSSVLEAANSTKLNEDSVRRSCTLETGFVHNRSGELFVFRYIGEDYTEEQIKSNKNSNSIYFRKINIYDYKTNELIDTLYNTIQCATKYNLRVPYVRLCCQNKIKYVTCKQLNRRLTFKFYIE